MPGTTERTIYKAVTGATEVVLAGCAAALGLSLLLVPGVFAAGVYGPLAVLMPQAAWGGLFLALSAGRLLATLALPGRSLRARRLLSMATLVCVWLPLWISFTWYALLWLYSGRGALLPGTFLAPAVACHELVCWMVLTALAARRLPAE